MGKALVKVNEYFVVKTDDGGNETEVIYNPPLLAQTQNIRVELRKEKKHERPHVHVIKKGRDKFHGVSIALDDFTVLAGEDQLKHFDSKEFQYISHFLWRNRERFMTLYQALRGDL